MDMSMETDDSSDQTTSSESGNFAAGVLKQTLIPSPIIKHIFHCNVSIYKKFDGLANETSQSDGHLLDEQTWRQIIHPDIAPSMDSQDLFDDDDDVDDIFNRSINDTANETITDFANAPSKLESVLVIIKDTSMTANGNETRLPSSVRSACLIPGRRLNNNEPEEERYGEDSILLTLTSGYLLLIRIYLTEQSEFRPFSVQWWNLGYKGYRAKLTDSGKDLKAHASGLSIVSTSGLDLLKIHNCKYTKNGLILEDPFNFKIDGTVLDSCFLDSLDDAIENNHIMFLALVITKERRLEIHLLEWFSGESVNARLQEYVLPLPNSFEIPIFIVSVKSMDGFAFFSEKEVTIIRIHEIMSGHGYKFTAIPSQMSFPTSYYKPRSVVRNANIIGEKRDEILIATENGVIYSFLIDSESFIDCKQLLRVSSCPDVFTMERNSAEVDDWEYRLIYSDDQGSGKHIMMNTLISENEPFKPENRVKYVTDFIIIDDFDNWAPLVDYKVFKSQKSKNLNNHSDEELWSLSGTGRKTSLTHLRYGIKGTTLLRDPDFKNASKLFKYEDESFMYFICSYSFETKVLKYSLNDSDSSEIERISSVTENSPLDLSCRTLALSKLTSIDAAIQITESSISISDMDVLYAHIDIENDIILCDVLNESFILISEHSSVDEEGVFMGKPILKLGLFGIKTDGITENGMIEPSEVFVSIIEDLEITYEPSLVKLFYFEDALYIMVASYAGELHFYQNLEGKTLKHTIIQFDNYLKGITVNDMVQSNINGAAELYLGSREGYFLQLELFKKDDLLTVSVKRYLKISDTPVELVKTDIPQTLLLLSRNLWKLDFSRSPFPEKVIFKEVSDKASHSVVQITNAGANTKLGLLREDGFSIASIRSNPSCCPKSIRIGETSKKFTFMRHISTFAVISHADDTSSRLEFYDKRKMKKFQTTKIKSKYEVVAATEPLFAKDELPLSLSQWNVKKDESKSYIQLVVGSQANNSSGSIRIFDVNKVQSNNGEMILVAQLNSWKTERPVYSISQLGDSSVIYSSGTLLNIREYNLSAKKLHPNQEVFDFQSTVCSITVHGKDVFVSTFRDSTYHFVYENGSLTLIHRDSVNRNLLNEASAVNSIIVSDKLHSSVSGLELIPHEKNLRNYFKSSLSFIPRLGSCQLNAIWVNDESKKMYCGRRILACGVNGEVICYTLLGDDQYKSLNTLTLKLKEASYIMGKRVTGKGFYDLNQIQWSSCKWDFNVIDGDRLSQYEDIHHYNSLAFHSLSL